MVSTFLCGPNIYSFNGWLFEFGYCGPWPLTKDGELRARRGGKFLSDVEEFCKMSEDDQKKYCVGGGCDLV